MRKKNRTIFLLNTQYACHFADTSRCADWNSFVRPWTRMGSLIIYHESPSISFAYVYFRFYLFPTSHTSQLVLVNLDSLTTWLTCLYSQHDWERWLGRCTCEGKSFYCSSNIGRENSISDWHDWSVCCKFIPIIAFSFRCTGCDAELGLIIILPIL